MARRQVGSELGCRELALAPVLVGPKDGEQQLLQLARVVAMTFEPFLKDSAKLVLVADQIEKALPAAKGNRRPNALRFPVSPIREWGHAGGLQAAPAVSNRSPVANYQAPIT